MPIGNTLENEFNTLIKNAAPTQKINEVFLFNCLKMAFEALNLGGINKCEVIHGKKSFVDFAEKTSDAFYYHKDRGTKVTCELSDLLFVVADQKTKELRVCLLQNKYKNNTGSFSITDSFEATMRQFYLLKKRPVFYKNNTTTGIDLLDKAICPSVGSYGVFFNNTSVGGQSMYYYSGNILDVKTPTAKGLKRKVEKQSGALKYLGFPIGVSIQNQYTQVQYTDTISEFGDELESMHIGTPFSFKSGLKIINNQEIIDGLKKLGIITDDEALEYAVDSAQPSIEFKSAIVLKAKR